MGDELRNKGFEAVRNRFLEHHFHEQDRRRICGHVRPIVSAEYRGDRYVAIGGRFLRGKWKTFLDFLADYIKFVLTPEWGQAELRKPLEQRHVIMQWYDGVCRFQVEHIKEDGVTTQIIPSGVVAAYYLLAYDLYLLNHHHLMQDVLVRRLKDPNQFQGARYELFVSATAIRAGLRVEFENERDSSRKHPEFIATHPETGQKVAVEAKSRHRNGGLGRGGIAPVTPPKAGIQRLVRDAAGKIDDIPMVLFLDVNLPDSDPHVFEIPWVMEVLGSLVERAERHHGGKDPFNIVIITNHPHHYGSPDEPDPKRHCIAMIAKDPLVPIAHPAVLNLLFDASNKYGNIPQFFDV